MTMWMLLALHPALAADDVAVLKGTQCTPRGACTDFDITLYDTGRFVTSNGDAGTYSLPANAKGYPELHYTLGREDGVFSWTSLNCWEDAGSPLNPDLGTVNVCLTAETQLLRPYSFACDAQGL